MNQFAAKGSAEWITVARHPVSVVLVVALTAGLLGATPASGAEPKVQAERDVKGISAETLSPPEAGNSSVSVDAPGKVPRLIPGTQTVTTRTNLSQVTRGITAIGDETALRTTDWADLPTWPIDVARVAPSGSSALKASTYNVTILSARERERLGNPLIALRVEQTTGQSGNIALRLPTEVLEQTFGADYASRVQWKQFPRTATSGAAISTSSKPVQAFEDPSSDSVVLQTRSDPASEQMVAAFGAPVSASGTGDFSATSLKPSDSWDVSAQTGAFAWSYPLRSPPAAAGPLPDVALDYNSQAVDGATGSTNNQPSPAGEGWSVGGSGFIERSYVPCASDTGAPGPVTSSGDLCWFTDNAVLSLAGHSSTLVRDQATGSWKLQNDDNSRIEHLVGTAAGCGVNGTATNDCWRLTTTDGTQYYFGLNQLPGWTAGKPTTNSTWTVPVFGNDPGEPCKSTTFAASSCNQAWRWNLDFVVDTHHNAQVLYYNAETNKYSRNGSTVTSYVRGGNLEHIDYGLRDSAVYAANAASDRFVFEYDARGRCNDVSGQTCTNQPASGDAVAPANPSAYPDVPFDQLCTSGTCANLLSPTFWTTARLKTINTKVLKGSTYQLVDSWALEHTYPNPGDATSAALWLAKVTHTGTSGSNTLAEPATSFTGTTMQNRVWAVDGLAPLNKYRISSISTSLGAVIAVNYSSQECTPQQASAILASPQTNTKRCFPQWWSPQVTPPQPAQLDLFHKYVVASVISDPRTGGGNDAVQQTSYVYTGTPAWRYQTSRLVPEKRRTWSVYAGYNSVEVRVGDPAAPATAAVTAYTFYQGMDGDRATTSGGTKAVSVTGSPGVADSVWFAGQVRQTQTRNGVDGPVVQTVLQTPWTSAVTATDGENAARRVDTGQTVTTEPVSTGGTRSTTVSTSFDASWGLPTQISVARSEGGLTCERTSYAAPNTTSWVIGLTAEVNTVGVSCSVTPSYPADAVSRSRTFYDNQAAGAAATVGDPTRVEIVDRYSAGQPVWITDSITEFDALGRPTKVTNAAGQAVSTAYTPSASAPTGSGPLTLVTTTNAAPFNWTSSVSYDPAWGAVLSRTDENGKVTSAAYDALGRRTGVWLPGRAQSTYPSAPHTRYEYVLSQTAPNVVKTSQLGPTSIVPSFELIDGLGQIVQTQKPAVGGGLIINDRGYDAAGRVISTYNDYWASAATGGMLFVPNNVQNIGSVTLTGFDGAARPLHSITQSYGAERFRTSYTYLAADRTDTTPPNGGTPTTEIIDSRGLKTRLVQYLAATPSAIAQKIATDYSYNARGDLTRMVDAAGTAWTWTFDIRGRRVASVDPDSGSTTTNYDVLSNVTSTKDARNVTLSYAYDNLNRKTRKYEGPLTGSLLTSWTYDTLLKGQLSSSSTYEGSTPGTPGAAYTQLVGGTTMATGRLQPRQPSRARHLPSEASATRPTCSISRTDRSPLGSTRRLVASAPNDSVIRTTASTCRAG